MQYNLQIQRQNKQNTNLTNQELEKIIVLTKEQKQLLAIYIDKFELSARSYTKVLKVARTIADLEGNNKIESKHLIEALGFQRC